MNHSPHRAFTLIELIVVMAVIAILAAFAYPVYQRSVASGQATACLSNLRQLGSGLNAYLNDNEMKMPTLQIARDSLSQDVPVIDNTLDKYLPDKRAFACPADDKNFAHWHSGPVIGDPACLGDALAEAIRDPGGHYAAAQKQLFDDTFDLTDVPSSLRAAEVVARVAGFELSVPQARTTRRLVNA